MNQINVQYYKTKIGELIVGSFDNKLCLFDFRYRKMRNSVDRRLQQGLDAEFINNDSNVLVQTRLEFDEYLNGDRKEFSIPLLLVGSCFQKNVWAGLMQVPFGETLSYLQLAKKIDAASAVRAVGSANGANAISIFVPCHRIVGSQGELTGYGGGLAVKKRLLKLESESLF
ncbi:Methylated-DNA--protein-cysteine methyltransferase [hydrothermal vent metagenome]|uniref:methylated-DNA--[protein]-cysteine S-methyltransferase n=1 Tax=hydrothermal vent metagenome TaxID=652676 RepID=A0A3B0XR26_9ZZZZ